MIRPSRARFFLERHPQPLTLSLPLPQVPPIELYQRISAPRTSSFLLESAKGPSQTARYSYLGNDPYLIFAGRHNRYETRAGERVLVQEGDPFEALAALLRRGRMPRPDGVPPFFGGAVGYFSYDLIRGFETLPHQTVDDLQLPDLLFLFVDLLAACDHLTHTLHLIFAPPLERMLGETREKLYREGCDRLAAFEAQLSSAPIPLTRIPADLHVALNPEQPRAEYMEKVLQCQEFICSGDIYQINLSHRFAIDCGEDSAPGSAVRRARPRELAKPLYESLCQVNPAPFAGILESDDLCLVSASPERLVRLQERQVDTRPIAGTRPRGGTLSEDRKLVEDLLTNHKERAEHIMLVDLERNDLGRVCRYGSVRIDEFMNVERYSHVSHIVSNIQGTLRDDLDGFDLIRAVFPGGTVTGVPKIRCMEILEQLEPVRRGPYTGSLGYLSWNGDLDFNIIIRTLVLSKTGGYLQVGAGIVADSNPAREYEETLHKAEAFFQALRRS